MGYWLLGGMQARQPQGGWTDLGPHDQLRSWRVALSCCASSKSEVRLLAAK